MPTPNFPYTFFNAPLEQSVLVSMSIGDFFSKKLVVRQIMISEILGRQILEWLWANPTHIVSTYSGFSGMESIHTAYFNLMYSHDEGIYGTFALEPSYIGDRYPEAETPTMLELWFGLKKKYMQHIKKVMIEYPDIPEEKYLLCMHKQCKD